MPYIPGGLIHVDEIEFAKESLKQSGSFYLAVIMKLLKNKLLNLNDAAECFFHPQTMMLCNAVFFAGIDDILLANTFISWKCLSTEFYALLARMGVSSCLLNLFNKLEAFKLDGRGKDREEEALVQLSDQYHKEVTEIMQKWGEGIINILLKQSWDEVQKNIGPRQMLLQYCMSPLYDTSCYPVPIPPKVLSLTGVVIAILSDGPPIVKTLDFGKIQDLALESHNKAMKAVAIKHQGNPWQDVQAEADKTASELLEAVFPDELQSLISSVAIESVYFCPDQVLAKYPIEALLFRDGKRLGEEVAISYLSSARELLRESTYSLFCSDLITQDPDAKTGSINKCTIFANPNFDMEKTGSGNYWGLLGSLLSPFFSTASEGICRVHSLAGSEEEAYDIKYLLSSSQISGEPCQIDVALGDDATLHRALQVHSPLILHFATHGFSSPDFHYQYHNFWSDTKSGLLLAGANTYHLQKYSSIDSGAGTGELTALAACGMKLTGTRLVYLSSCRSSYGFIGRGEALSSLAQGFRVAGSQTVIATLWPVSDEVGRKMAFHFYSFIKQGMRPSLALQAAKRELREGGLYEHWYDWAGFLCIGIDLPILFAQ
jgi:CHAT domain-containing protein